MWSVATQGLILAAEESESSGIDLLLPETSELIAGVIAFGIIFFFVWKWVLPTLNKTLENRRQAIVGEMAAAEGAKREAETLLEDYRAQLSGARDEANRIVDEARQTAEGLRTDIVAKAEEEATALKQRAQADIAGERERAAAALKGEVAALSMDVAERVVGHSLDRDAQRGLVDRFIEDLGGMRTK